MSNASATAAAKAPSTKKLHTPKYTQEQMFQAAHDLAMNSPASDFVRISVPNLLAVTLVGANAKVSLGFAVRKRAEADERIKALEAELALAYKGADGFARDLAKYRDAYGPLG